MDEETKETPVVPVTYDRKVLDTNLGSFYQRLESNPVDFTLPGGVLLKFQAGVINGENRNGILLTEMIGVGIAHIETLAGLDNVKRTEILEKLNGVLDTIGTAEIEVLNRETAAAG